MSRFPLWITTIMLLGAAAPSAFATAPTETAAPDSATVQISPEMADASTVAATPLDREVATIRDAFHSRLTELTARYGAATDAAVATDTQREIAALKMQLELDLLGIQLRLARERNDTAAITELEQSLTAARARLVADTGLEAPAAPADSVTR